MTTIKHYGSLGEFLLVAEKGSQGRCATDRGNRKFYGDRNFSECLKYVRGGATPHETREAEKLYNQIDASFRDREASAWVPSVAGAYPSVPDYLIGNPESMRQRKPVESDIAPVRVYVEPIVSHGVTEGQMRRRGAAITALVARMAEIRPVELIIFTAMKWGTTGTHNLTTFKLDVAPVSISQVTALFTREFARRTVFAALHATTNNMHTGDDVHWALGKPSEAREGNIRTALDCNPQDVILQGGYITDSALMDSNPVQWVHNQLEKQRTLEY